MYKLIRIFFSLALILPLSACGGVEARQEDSGAAAEAEIYQTGEIGGEITVSAYETMRYKAFLEDAARLFEEKYPGTTVNVETFSALPELKSDGEGNVMAVLQGDDSQSRSDYINRINTELMSGTGADILAMDILPFYKYADAGQLLNLAECISEDPEFNRADYRENILDAVEYKNGIWFLPMDYTFNYYTYDSSLLTGNAAEHFGTSRGFTVSKLMELAEPSFDGSARLFNRPDYADGPRPDLWSLLLAENYKAFVDIENKKVNFDDGSFAALLESVKEYSEKGYIPEGFSEKEGDGAREGISGEGGTEHFFFKPQNVINLISLFTRDLGISMSGMAEGGTMAIGENDEIAGIAVNADASVPFACEQAYGINGASKNKETAWAFLRFLLSEEIQLNPNLSPVTLPLLNSAREKKMELMLASMTGQEGQPLSEAAAQAISEYNAAVEELSNQINTFVINDSAIDGMIASEVRYFFDGTKTAADDVAEVLQNKVDLYINE